tara:strand:- start:414 stop:614 length:201 start_codon:yes stop_codon:yes gene_type:complete
MSMSWDKIGPTFLNRIRSLSNLKIRWVVERTKVKGQEPSKVETLKFLDKWIKILNEMREEILKSRS